MSMANPASEVSAACRSRSETVCLAGSQRCRNDMRSPQTDRELRNGEGQRERERECVVCVYVSTCMRVQCVCVRVCNVCAACVFPCASPKPSWAKGCMAAGAGSLGRGRAWQGLSPRRWTTAARLRRQHTHTHGHIRRISGKLGIPDVFVSYYYFICIYVDTCVCLLYICIIYFCIPLMFSSFLADLPSTRCPSH